MARISLVSPALIVLLIVGGYAVAATAQVPLDYTDSGYEIVPGYAIPVLLHAEGAYDLGYAFAPVAVKVDGAHQVEVGIRADPPGFGGLSGMRVYFFIIVDGNYRVKQVLDEIGPFSGKREYDVQVTLALYCDGTLEVKSAYGSVRVKLAPVAYSLYEYTTSMDSWYVSSVVSRVTYGEAEIVDQACVQQVTTTSPQLPPPGSGASGGQATQTQQPTMLDPNKLMLLGVGLVMAVVGAIVVMTSAGRKGGGGA